MQKGVLEGAGVAIGQDEPVTAEPMGIGRIEVEVAGKEDVGEGCQGHGGTGMARVGLLDHVHGEALGRRNAFPVQFIKHFTHHDSNFIIIYPILEREIYLLFGKNDFR